MNFLKSTILSTLIVANLASCLMLPLVYLDFEVRRDYIAEVLCIERDKPITVCGGSCYLSKQLGKAQEQQEDAEQLSPRDFTFFFEGAKLLMAATKQISTEIDVLISGNNEQIPSSLFAFDIFHPPRLG